MTPDAGARRCVEALWAQDRASQALGMRLLEVAPGRATLSMPVRDDMVNGHSLGHGGMTFALAEPAFAFACNTVDRRTVAAGAQVRFLAPTRRGDTLVARAVERSRDARGGVHDVTVVAVGRDGGSDTVVATFVGQAREIGGALIEGDAAQPG